MILIEIVLVISLSALWKVIKIQSSLWKVIIEKELEQLDIETKDEDGESFGVLDFQDDYSIEDVVIKNLEDDGLVKAFLDYRENTWLSEGSDVWRLMQLVEMGDKLAGYKLRNLLEETDGAELIRDVIENKSVYRKIKDIFNSSKE